MNRQLISIGVTVLLLSGATVAAQPVTSVSAFDPLVERLREAVSTSDIDGYLELLAADAVREDAELFAEEAFTSGFTNVVMQARFAVPLTEDTVDVEYELTIEVFAEEGNQGRLQTWRLHLQPAATADDVQPWRIQGQRLVDDFVGLHHLSLDPNDRYDAANLVIVGEDMTLRMVEGTVFVERTDQDAVTGLVLMGDGLMTFSPTPEAEQGQLRILSGQNVLEDEFTAAFVRVNPETFDARVSTSTLTPPADTSVSFADAQELFERFVPLSFAVNLSDFSDKTWSLVPGTGNLIAEIETDRYGTLTYSQAQNNAEDITLFERETRRILSLYPSAQKRATQGRYYSDNDNLAYDVLHYEIDASFTPSGVTQTSFRSRPELLGCFIDATTRLVVDVTAPNLSAMTLRLADELNVHSVVSEEFGPLLFLRMRGQNNVVVSLPQEVPIGTQFTLDISYSGLLSAQELAENWIGRQRQLWEAQPLFGFSSPRYIYSNSSYWYPQSIATDYATATLDLRVPQDFGVIASGDPVDNNPPVWATSDTNDDDSQREYRFVTAQPARYLSCVISQFAEGDGFITEDITLDLPPEDDAPRRNGVSYDTVSLQVWSSPRTQDRVTEYREDAADILKFYAGIMGDVPYPTFTLALTDAILPGGHAPAYFAILNQPLPVPTGQMRSWRTDPVAFSSFPTFFVAHELAHQWWGQAIGWKNYHEQWLSEGLAQYFAALYAEHRNGPNVFVEVLTQMQRWSTQHTDRGPVYLGSRLGVVDNEPRVFRSLVYNKSALVLHMLRRTLGDATFFAGLRRFYNEHRFTKTGTDDLIRAFEEESERSLSTFFERWIHETSLPNLTVTYHTETVDTSSPNQTEVVLHFEQQGPVFEVPVTVTFEYERGGSESFIVPIADRVTDIRLPASQPLRDVKFNDDSSALAKIE